jgi:ParB-like chromosome segregation protein Spo0J
VAPHAPEREIVTVPVQSLKPGESPRSGGESKAHIARLAEVEGPLPPILVDRRTMRVIDGMHRLLAAALKGQETVSVVFFDGSPADAFLQAVRANVTHGLPLSQADRRAAAERIIASHPHLSDRAIAESVGLAARTVAAIRRRFGAAVTQLTSRVGRDGRVRPLNSADGRSRAAAAMAANPRASLREVARSAGISPATAHDVRRRLERGEQATPAGVRAAPARPGTDRPGTDLAGTERPGTGRPGTERHGTDLPGRPPPVRPRAVPSRQVPSRAVPSRAVSCAPADALEKLLRDPSLRHNEHGRQLLRLLQLNAAGAQQWAQVTSALPPHCAALVIQLARHYARMWARFAAELDEPTQAADPRRPA